MLLISLNKGDRLFIVDLTSVSFFQLNIENNYRFYENGDDILKFLK